MHVEGNKVYLDPEEVAEAMCPRRLKWAISQVLNYGPGADPSTRLGSISRCPEVLKGAGYEPIIKAE